MQLFYEPIASDNSFTLNKEEAQHCIKVLRKNIGDEITIIDGLGTFYQCVIETNDIKNCQVKVLSKSEQNKPDRIIHIAIAPTKNIDRIEWFVEKSVEIGISEISFILTQNSERRVLKSERVFKKAISAMKQSLKARLPKINELISYREFLTKNKDAKELFIAYVDDENQKTLSDAAQRSQSPLVLIGPEGDFSNDELELAQDNGFQKVSLGKSRLRTETAGIVATTLLNNL